DDGDAAILERGEFQKRIFGETQVCAAIELNFRSTVADRDLVRFDHGQIEHGSLPILAPASANLDIAFYKTYSRDAVSDLWDFVVVFKAERCNAKKR
ncbi:MAG: hypothetical protein LC730_02235, partial [Acidobacteria bacterium]|nr:hypothetical protein [Acidobacteriota bacterium]